MRVKSIVWVRKPICRQHHAIYRSRCLSVCAEMLSLFSMRLTAIKYSCPPRAFSTFSLSILFVLLSFLNFSSEFCKMLFAILSRVCRQPGHRCCHPPRSSQRHRACHSLRQHRHSACSHYPSRSLDRSTSPEPASPRYHPSRWAASTVQLSASWRLLPARPGTASP